MYMYKSSLKKMYEAFCLSVHISVLWIWKPENDHNIQEHLVEDLDFFQKVASLISNLYVYSIYFKHTYIQTTPPPYIDKPKGTVKTDLKTFIIRPIWGQTVQVWVLLWHSID